MIGLVIQMLVQLVSAAGRLAGMLIVLAIQALIALARWALCAVEDKRLGRVPPSDPPLPSSPPEDKRRGPRPLLPEPWRPRR